MLDINFIRENPEKVKDGAKKKGYDPKIVDRVLKVDEIRRQLLAEVDKWRQARNKQACFSQAQNKLKKGEVEKGKKIKEMLRRLEPDLRAVDEQFENLLAEIPNLPADDVPKGRDESENVEMKKWGKPKKLGFKPKDYQQLGESLDLIDTKTASKVSGTRFGYLKNEAVQLEFALVQLALETLVKEGFTPVVPPVLIKNEIMKGMGYLEHGGEDQAYHLTKDKLYLIGTAEQSVGPMHAGEIFGAKDLPRRYVGFSTCLRREAGTYGKDTKGIFRVHQFDKLEMFSYIKPQKNADKKEHDYLLSLEEKLVKQLEIPYQITKMCTGDLGHPTARKYDLNCWFLAERKYRETHSAAATTDYQARRLNIKYRNGNKTDFVHTLNATAFAIGRIILAILENYQQKDGSVEIPKVLQKYAGIKKISPKK